MQVILYPRKDGGVCVVTPVMNSQLTIDEIAAKDVPTGVPYVIVESETVPKDRYFRDAWEADFSSPDGYGAAHGIQPEDAA